MIHNIYWSVIISAIVFISALVVTLIGGVSEALSSRLGWSKGKSNTITGLVVAFVALIVMLISGLD